MIHSMVNRPIHFFIFEVKQVVIHKLSFILDRKSNTRQPVLFIIEGHDHRRGYREWGRGLGSVGVTRIFDWGRPKPEIT